MRVPVTVTSLSTSLLSCCSCANAVLAARGPASDSNVTQADPNARRTATASTRCWPANAGDCWFMVIVPPDRDYLFEDIVSAQRLHAEIRWIALSAANLPQRKA